MTRPNRSTIYLVAAALAIAAVVGLGVWLIVGRTARNAALKNDSANDSMGSAADKFVETLPLNSWKENASHTVPIAIDPTAGPIWQIDPENRLILTPTHPEIELKTWRILEHQPARPSGDDAHPDAAADASQTNKTDADKTSSPQANLTQITGTGEASGTLEGAKIRAIWTFAAGNPTAHLRLILSDVPARALSRNIRFSLEFPPGDLKIPPNQPLNPVQRASHGAWHHENARNGENSPKILKFYGWTGDDLQARRPASAAQKQEEILELNLWNAARHTGYASCAEADKDLKVILEAELLFDFSSQPSLIQQSLRSAQKSDLNSAETKHSKLDQTAIQSIINDDIFVWPYPAAASAATLPIFGMPAHHHDPLLAEAAAPDARRWIARARTLIYGHSDLDDPRYANGGLLGNDLGATIIFPGQFGDAPEVQALKKALANTRVELLPWTDQGASDATGPGRALRELSCEALVSMQTTPPTASGGQITQAAIALEGEPVLGADALNAAPGGLPATLIPELFDGRLKTLLTQGLDPDESDAALKNHQTRAFITPFVATRNPLIAAAHQSILVPEPWGHWRLDDELSDALTHLGLWAETTPMLITSVGHLAEYRQVARHVHWWWDETGELRVHNPNKQSIDGFTLRMPPGIRAEFSSAEDKANTSRLRQRALTADSSDFQQNAQQNTQQNAQKDAQQPAATLLWWNLRPGITTLKFRPDDEMDPPPAPEPGGVRWKFSSVER